MNAKHRQIIKFNRSVLEEKICLDKLKPYLIEYKMFNKYMWNDIHSTSDMFDLLPSRGPKAFMNFIEILRKADYNDEADCLEKTTSSDVTDNLFYKMSTVPLGYCVIINNFDFSTSKVRFTDKYRLGSDVDEKSLTDFFEGIDFHVIPKRDMKAAEMKQYLKEFSNKDFTNVDAIVVIILSHGGQEANKEIIYGTDGDYIFKKDIYETFNNKVCKELQNKPKIFFFLACRGKGLDYGVPQESPKESIDSTPGYENNLTSVSDIFLVHSSLPDNVSMRHHEKGSFFCDALVDVLNKHHKDYDLLTIINHVNAELEFKKSEVYRTVQAAHYEAIAAKKKVKFYRTC